MIATIDAAGRIVVPKRLREELGFTPGQQLELSAVDGRRGAWLRSPTVRCRS
jgi:AbrB family looped-hinge helix DNA binding protein